MWSREANCYGQAWLLGREGERGCGCRSFLHLKLRPTPKQVAGTPHYDGVIRNRNEPAIIAICGIGPVNYKLVDPSKPGWRAV